MVYQSIVSPALTLADIAGIKLPVQKFLFPPLTGEATTEQLQSGAVTGNVSKQPLSPVTVSVISVPVFTALTNHTWPLVFVTVPDVLVNTPELTVTTSE